MSEWLCKLLHYFRFHRWKFVEVYGAMTQKWSTEIYYCEKCEKIRILYVKRKPAPWER